jgi:hypothetical protein
MSPLDPDHFTDMDGNPTEDVASLCPVCGSGADQLVVERGSAEHDPNTSYHVECLKCGCNGPQRATQVEAGKEWNARSGWRKRPSQPREESCLLWHPSDAFKDTASVL